MKEEDIAQLIMDISEEQANCLNDCRAQGYDNMLLILQEGMKALKQK